MINHIYLNSTATEAPAFRCCYRVVEVKGLSQTTYRIYHKKYWVFMLLAVVNFMIGFIFSITFNQANTQWPAKSVTYHGGCVPEHFNSSESYEHIGGVILSFSFSLYDGSSLMFSPNRILIDHWSLMISLVSGRTKHIKHSDKEKRSRIGRRKRSKLQNRFALALLEPCVYIRNSNPKEAALVFPMIILIIPCVLLFLMKKRRMFFICHTGVNKWIAVVLLGIIEDSSDNAWLDRLNINEENEKSIVSGVLSSDVLIHVETKDSMSSEWCRFERRLAKGLGKRIVAFRPEELITNDPGNSNIGTFTNRLHHFTNIVGLKMWWDIEKIHLPKALFNNEAASFSTINKVLSIWGIRSDVNLLLAK